MSTLETVRVLGHYFNSWRYERWSQWIALCELIDNGVEHSTLMEIASIVLNRFDQANSLPRIAS